MYESFLAYLSFRKKLAKNITKGRWNDLIKLADLVEKDFTAYVQLDDWPVYIDFNTKINIRTFYNGYSLWKIIWYNSF